MPWIYNISAKVNGRQCWYAGNGLFTTKKEEAKVLERIQVQGFCRKLWDLYGATDVVAIRITA